MIRRAVGLCGLRIANHIHPVDADCDVLSPYGHLEVEPSRVSGQRAIEVAHVAQATRLRGAVDRSIVKQDLVAPLARLGMEEQGRCRSRLGVSLSAQCEIGVIARGQQGVARLHAELLARDGRSFVLPVIQCASLSLGVATGGEGGREKAHRYQSQRGPHECFMSHSINAC